MRRLLMVLAAAFCLSATSASAKDILCEGIFENHGNAGGSVAGQEVDCFIPANGQPAERLFDFCTDDVSGAGTYCQFIGHYSRRNGREYVIDRIRPRRVLEDWFSHV